ncbi:glycoside hydrolase family 19 protein [Cupriavidus pinatubonensis]|uniref:Glycoside hydrolase, family 19 n=1 Tax=Cupriavidus pinatubonensis TaxID=248026 RepID=A0ABM8WKY0_9BURK|nr:hypothetical protein [Cupriavidus pinatubonensis]CAG9168044.1 hypothetical protein LMG23994_01287 [Cupriavidus pinatubonensis]
MANQTPTNPPDTRVKQLRFAYPFRKKGQGNVAGAEFTDEHEFHKLLKRESLGNYSVSSKGMWHGGIHVSELGAGAALDLKFGVRCMADGEVVAFRINRAYLVSQMPAQGAEPAREARYSTGFALVRHTMEFPKNNKLTFFSLYMHLQDLAGYEGDRALPKPAYWMPDFKVTQFAHDRPTAGAGRMVPADQIGLKVRATQPHGTPLCILPRGVQFSISKREGDWGQIKDTQGAQLIAPSAGGYVEPNAAINGWVFLGREGGHYAAEEVMPDSRVDRVVTLDRPFQIKAGDLIGHLGRYDSLSRRAENRTVHIEVFCGDGIKDFIRQGRDWVVAHGHDQAKWRALGLSSEPTILRVAANTTLYRAPLNQGERPSVTDVIQVIAISELEKNPDNKRLESDGRKIPWWHVTSVDEHGRDIDGWVRQEGFSGGRVTREFVQSWVDFGIFEKPHDPTHTMFATAKSYIDYRTEADVPARAALEKLSPLMAEVYRAIFPRGDGSRAADELCQATDDPWRALRVSRLLIKHESEWANPAKWQQLIGEMERVTGQRPEFGEERRRIERLVWWDAVKGGVSDLPGSSVFHIHPIGLVSNFCDPQLITLEMLAAVNPHGSREYHERILPALNKYARGYFIITPRRIAHFLSQISVESRFKNVEESLNYSARRMKEVYGCKPPSRGSKTPIFSEDGNDIVCNFGQLRSKLWTNTDYYSNNPEHLGNYVYADRYGNGSEASGDGYKYRGRGLIQITFKENYETFKSEHNRRFPHDQQDFVADPDLLLNDIDYGIESAFVYWAVKRNINPIADNGDVRAVTLKVNGGENGISERRAAYNKVATILGLPPDGV